MTIRDELTELYIKGETTTNSFENLKKNDAGKIWKKLMEDIARGDITTANITNEYI